MITSALRELRTNYSPPGSSIATTSSASINPISGHSLYAALSIERTTEPRRARDRSFRSLGDQSAAYRKHPQIRKDCQVVRKESVLLELEEGPNSSINASAFHTSQWRPLTSCS